MSKWRFYLLRIGICGGVGIAIYVLLQFLLALLVVKNLLLEEQLMVSQIAAGGVSALIGGFSAIRITRWVPASGMTGLCIAFITVILGFVIYDGILLNSNTLLRISVMLIGGILPTLFLGKKGRKRGGKIGNRRVRRT